MTRVPVPAEWPRWDEIEARAVDLNHLPYGKWMEQPLPLRVALDVLNPQHAYDSTPLERELARYIVHLFGGES